MLKTIAPCPQTELPEITHNTPFWQLLYNTLQSYGWFIPCNFDFLHIFTLVTPLSQYCTVSTKCIVMVLYNCVFIKLTLACCRTKDGNYHLTTDTQMFRNKPYPKTVWPPPLFLQFFCEMTFPSGQTHLTTKYIPLWWLSRKKKQKTKTNRLRTQPTELWWPLDRGSLFS